MCSVCVCVCILGYMCEKIPEQMFACFLVFNMVTTTPKAFSRFTRSSQSHSFIHRPEVVEVNLRVAFITWDCRKSRRQTYKMSLRMFKEFPVTSVNRYTKRVVLAQEIYIFLYVWCVSNHFEMPSHECPSVCLQALFPDFCRPPTLIAVVIGEVITPFPQEICPSFLAPATVTSL